MMQMQQATEVPVLLGSLLSLALCCWLLCCSLRRLPAGASSRLLLKQIATLARADIMTALIGLVLSIGNLGLMPVSIGVTSCWILNNVVWTLWLWGLCVSTLVEVHIAAAIFAKTLRKERALASLKRCLPLVWATSFVLALADPLLVRAKSGYDEEKQVCQWVSQVGTSVVRDGFSAPVTCTVAAVSLVANAVVYSLLNCAPSHWFQRTITPMSVERRTVMQMLRYSLVAVFTWLPFWIVALTGRSPSLFWASDWWGLASALPMSLNGALNVWAYAAHNRHLRQLSALPQAAGGLEGSPDKESFAVGFRSYTDCVDIIIVPSCATGSTSMASEMMTPSASFGGLQQPSSSFSKTPLVVLA